MPADKHLTERGQVFYAFKGTDPERTLDRIREVIEENLGDHPTYLQVYQTKEIVLGLVDRLQEDLGYNK